MNDFSKKHIDELIENRLDARINKNFALSDQIRNYLDEKLIFIFDMKDNFQEVHYLPKSYFNNMVKIETIKKIKFNSKRHFVEYQIKESIRAEKTFDAWLYSAISSSKQNQNKTTAYE